MTTPFKTAPARTGERELLFYKSFKVGFEFQKKGTVVIFAAKR